MNDNFESKFNNRSTPKKPQNHNENYDRKSVSVDVIYSELQITKHETNQAIINTTLKIDKFEEKFKRLDTDVKQIYNYNDTSKSTLEDIMRRLINVETKLGNVTELKNNFEALKTKVNDLFIEIEVIKQSNVESKNSLDGIIVKVTDSFNSINLSLEENFGVINNIMNANFAQSKNIINQLSEGTPVNSESVSKLKTNSTTPLLEKSLVFDTDVKSSQVDCKSSLFYKAQTSQINKDLKPKGDSTENEKDSLVTNVSKSNNVPILNSQPECIKSNEKLSTTINKVDETTKNFFGYKAFENQNATDKPNVAVKTDLGIKSTTDKANVAVKTDLGIKPTFGFQVNTDTQKSIFNNPNQPSLFSKNTPNKSESTVTNSGIFSGLKMTIPTRPNEPVFGSSGQQTGKLFGDFQDSNKLQTNLFAPKPIDSVDNSTTNIFNKPTSTNSLFKTELNEKKTESNIFGANSNAQSFSFLSETKAVGFGDSTEASWKAGSKLFGKNKSMTEETQHEDSVEDEHDPHFQPIIELPPLVHVTNDEELHDILFRNRCKLYRFINNEWKERGVGDMKIMQSKPEFDASRPVILLMRREQIRKICCNQRVSKDCPIFAAMPNATNKSTCWVATDYSEDEPKQEKFAVKFSSEEVLKEFQSVIARVQNELGVAN